jgi:hypothetical protein
MISMGDDIARRVRELETAVAVIVRHFGLEGEVQAAKDARRAEAVDRSENIGEVMSAATRAAHGVNQDRHR